MISLTDGILLVDKPANMTSFGVVARVRRVLTEQKRRQFEAGQAHLPNENLTHKQQKRFRVKVGHTGTLDPFATGLMILVVGDECKNAMHYTKLDKVYEATFQLGSTSTTGDPEGEVHRISEKVPSITEVKNKALHFVGDIVQKPPIYSAIKIDGQRAYDLARKGQTVDMPSRTVTIHSLEVLSYEYPYVRVRTHVSSGTYIRTLAEDFGESLGTGAYCVDLRRTKIADFDIADALSLDAILSEV